MNNFKKIPLKPTVAMHNAGAALLKPPTLEMGEFGEIKIIHHFPDVSKIYEAMVAVAPIEDRDIDIDDGA